MGLTKEQLALRRTGITASEIAVVAGLSTRKSAFAIWREKVEGGEIEAEEDHGPGWAEGVRSRGNFLEPAVLAWWLAQRAPAPVNVVYAKEVGTLISDRNPLLMASPDMLAFFDPDVAEPVEGKTSRSLEGWGIPGTDVVPMEYRAQVTIQMEVVRAPRSHVAVYFPHHDEFREYAIPFDFELWQMLSDAAQRFHRDYVVTGKPPPIDYSKDEASNWLRGRFPSEVGDRKKLRLATPEEEGMVSRLRVIDAERMKLEPESKALTNTLKEQIAEGAGLLFADGAKATWLKNADSERVNWVEVASYLRTLRVEGSITDEQWHQALQSGTRAKTGARVFRKSWTRHHKTNKGELTDE